MRGVIGPGLGEGLGGDMVDVLMAMESWDGMGSGWGVDEMRWVRLGYCVLLEW